MNLYQLSTLLLKQLEPQYEEMELRQVGGVEGFDYAQLLMEARNIHEDYALGRKGKGTSWITRKLNRSGYIEENVSVDGKRCNSTESLRHLIEWLNYRINYERLRAIWNKIAGVEFSPQPDDALKQMGSCKRVVVSDN